MSPVLDERRCEGSLCWIEIADGALYGPSAVCPKCLRFLGIIAAGRKGRLIPIHNRREFAPLGRFA